MKCNRKDSTNENTHIRAKYETSIFLLAIGLEEKQKIIQENIDKPVYPFSNNFRLGLNQFIALAYECGSDSILEELSNWSENYFIKRYCTTPISKWTERWNPCFVDDIKSSEYYDYDSLCTWDSNVFYITEDCVKLSAGLELSDPISSKEQRRYYEHISSGSQTDYLFGRLLACTKQALRPDEYRQIASGRFDYSQLGFNIPQNYYPDREWVEELLMLGYEKVDYPTINCPNCGWQIEPQKGKIVCTCCQFNSFDKCEKQKPVYNCYRLKHGVMKYIFISGQPELEVAVYTQKHNKIFELWPSNDTCDIKISLNDKETLAIDVKNYKNPYALAEKIGNDYKMNSLKCFMNFFVIPNDHIKKRPDYLHICNRAISGNRGFKCISMSDLKKIIREGVVDEQYRS